MLRTIFGRKGLAPGGTDPLSRLSPLRTPEPQATSWVMGEATPFTYLLGCLGDLKARGFGQVYPLVDAHLDRLSPAERGELLACLAPMEDLRKYHGQFPEKTPGGVAKAALIGCLRRKVEPELAHFEVLLALFLPGDGFNPVHHNEDKARLLRLLRGLVDKGAHLTSETVERLADYAVSLKETAHKAYRGEKAQLELSQAILRFAGREESATSILLERCEEPGTALDMLPISPVFALAMRLFAHIAEELASIERDLKGKTAPRWMTDPEAFAARFPPTPHVACRFGQWNDRGLTLEPVELREMLWDRGGTDDALRAQCPDLSDFAQFRSFMKHRVRRIASPDLYRDAAVAVHSHAHLLRHDWSTPAIPAFERLADLSDPAQTELLEQFVTAKSGPRPPALWLKRTMEIAGRIGADVVQKRLLDWLALYHTPCPDCATLWLAIDCVVLQHVVAGLERDHAPLLEACRTDALDVIAGAMALNIASGHVGHYTFGLSTFTVSKENGWTGLAFNPYSSTLGRAEGRPVSVLLKLFQFQILSPQNEQVLRAALWLLPHLPDRAATLEAIERSVLAGVAVQRASARSTGGGNVRSLGGAHAAVAGLVAIGDDVSDQALLRLSNVVEEPSVRKAILKALNG